MRKIQYRDIAWSREVAYAIGLLTTDGNLSPDGRHLELTSNDLDLIKIFRDCLGLTNAIGKKRSGYTGRKDAFRIQFGSALLYRQLLEIGLMPRKSKRMGALKIPDAYFFDFLRGHLDGDGTIRKYSDPVYPESRRLYLTFLSASSAHIFWLQNKIKDLAAVDGRIRKGVRVNVLIYSKRASLVLLKRLYDEPGIPCLKRKFFIAQEFIVASPRW